MQPELVLYDNVDIKHGNVRDLVTALLEELESGRIDVAVHSAEEIPVVLPDGLKLIALLKREDPRDIFISEDLEIDLENIRKNFLIGTSSLSRQAFLKHYAPQAEVSLLEGDLDVRIEKMRQGEVDGLLLSYASVRKTGISSMVKQKLNSSSFTPMVGQGATAVIIRSDNEGGEKIRTILNHAPTEYSIRCERAFLGFIESQTDKPAFGLATTVGDSISFSGGIVTVDGKNVWRGEADGDIGEAEAIGKSVAEQVLKKSN